MKQPRTPEEVLEAERFLLPFHALWQSKEFQEFWVRDIMGKDIEVLKAVCNNLSFQKVAGNQAKALDICGLKQPEDYEERRIAMVAMNAVVQFFERKLAYIAGKSKQYEALKKGQMT